MYQPVSSSYSYTFISRTTSLPEEDLRNQLPQNPRRYRHHHHHYFASTLEEDAGQDRISEQENRPRRCDLHHSIAQLYLSTLPSSSSTATGTRRRSSSSPRRKSRRHQHVSGNQPSETVPEPAVAMQDKSEAAAPVFPITSSSTTAIHDATFSSAHQTGFSKSPRSAFHPTNSFLHSQNQTFPALSTDSCSSTSSSSPPITSTLLRSWLASSMSNMYKAEVPLYGDLLSIISQVNSQVITSSSVPVLSDAEISRLSVERHGAIRVGTVEELRLLSRIFKVFGMKPVGYYDLWKDAGLPIHATAFRPIDSQELEKNPFRIFCSLLRLELVPDATVRKLAEDLLSKRQIVSQRCLELLHIIEAGLQSDDEVEQPDPDRTGVSGSLRINLSREQALEFVDRVVDIFKWHSETPVSAHEYGQLYSMHPLVADIVCFKGPHINHLTPRTLDIDQVQRVMRDRGMDAKEIVEGPPLRKNSIYLRQTSFHALSERVSFVGGSGKNEEKEGAEGGRSRTEGKHKARFGEIEARGQALTPKGARLYDELMNRAVEVKKDRESKLGSTALGTEEYERILKEVFKAGFTDDIEEIRKQGLGYFSYSITDLNLALSLIATTLNKPFSKKGEVLETLISKGAVKAEPITYEDFLPASAAGIFQSNLPQQRLTKKKECGGGDTNNDMEQRREDASRLARHTLMQAVGGTILDYFELYQKQQDDSLRRVADQLGLDVQDL